MSDLIVVVQRLKKDKNSKRKYLYNTQLALEGCLSTDMKDGIQEGGTIAWETIPLLFPQISIYQSHLPTNFILGKQVKYCFGIIHASQKIVICANNELEKTQWMDQLSNCIRNCSGGEPCMREMKEREREKIGSKVFIFFLSGGKTYQESQAKAPIHIPALKGILQMSLIRIDTLNCLISDE